MSKRQLKVFLCHSSGDKPAVRDLYERLRSAAGYISPWLDEEDLLPGQRWQDEIPKAVRDSDVVIVCLSQSSINKKGYVQKEIKYALDVADEQPEGAIFLIPVKLEECEIPGRLSHLQCVNIEGKGFERLISSLQYRARSLGINTVASGRPSGVEHKQKIRKEAVSPDAAIGILALSDASLQTAKGRANLRRVKPTKELFDSFFSALNEHYGSQNWWVREDKFQLCIEAILSQGTGWKNVGIAIENLKSYDALNAQTIYEMPEAELRALVRPCGRVNKAAYIKNFVDFLHQEYQLDIDRMLSQETTLLRRQLLGIKGIGEFTCDNILLYGAGRPKLPINERMRKVFFEHDLIGKLDSYDSVQRRMEGVLPFDAPQIREFDAMIYRVARDYCHTVPACEECPLKQFLHKQGPKSLRS